MNKLFVIAIAAGATACVTLLPEARSVKYTYDVADIRGCKLLGALEVRGPFLMPGDAEIQLKNLTAAAGGNAFLVTDQYFKVGGAAYRCY